MSLRWALFPRSSRPIAEIRGLIDVLAVHHDKISSKTKKLVSNEVLSVVADDLEANGYRVERGKTASGKIAVPVLFGINGVIEKSFHADGFHPESGVVLEVEAGRAVDNNQFLKDLFQACAMQDARHLALCVRNDYRGNDDFNKIHAFLDTLYVSNRIKLPLESIVLIGY